LFSARRGFGQAVMGMRVEAPELAAMFPTDAVSSAEAVWRQAVMRTTVSGTHRHVANCLHAMGVAFTVEQRTADGCFSVDIALAPHDYYHDDGRRNNDGHVDPSGQVVLKGQLPFTEWQNPNMMRRNLNPRISRRQTDRCVFGHAFTRGKY
jgi:hypothetical protein